MAQNIYCQSCGSPTMYQFNKPKVCSECGKPFASMPVVQKQNPVKKVLPSHAFQNDEVDDIEIPYIEKLAYTIKETRPNIARLTNTKEGKIIVAGVGFESGDDAQIKPIQKVKTKKFNKNEVLEKFRHDVGDKNPIDIGGS